MMKSFIFMLQKSKDWDHGWERRSETVTGNMDREKHHIREEENLPFCLSISLLNPFHCFQGKRQRMILGGITSCETLVTRNDFHHDQYHLKAEWKKSSQRPHSNRPETATIITNWVLVYSFGWKGMRETEKTMRRGWREWRRKWAYDAHCTHKTSKGRTKMPEGCRIRVVVSVDIQFRE